jgi:hypothetical protein
MSEHLKSLKLEEWEFAKREVIRRVPQIRFLL